MTGPNRMKLELFTVVFSGLPVDGQRHGIDRISSHGYLHDGAPADSQFR